MRDEDKRERVADLVGDASYVNAETIAALADYFDGLEDLRDAGLEELQEVKGVGAAKARAIKNEVVKAKARESAEKQANENET